jgi:hypothetical protein
MNSSKKFGLKKASQIRNVAEFTEQEIKELKAIQCEVNEEQEKKEHCIENFEESKESVRNT